MAVTGNKEVDIDAEPSAILEVLADVEGLPSWSPVHRKIEIIDRYDDGRPHHVEVEAGQMVFTPPRVEHWTVFPRETTLISVSKLRREHSTHESDLVRIAWFE